MTTTLDSKIEQLACEMYTQYCIELMKKSPSMKVPMTWDEAKNDPAKAKMVATWRSLARRIDKYPRSQRRD